MGQSLGIDVHIWSVLLFEGDPGDDLAVIREDDLNFLIDHPDTKSMPLASDSAYIGLFTPNSTSETVTVQFADRSISRLCS